MKNYKVYYSQNREDLIINGFFPDIKNGFYVDVGANHPFYHSVTKLFYGRGWSGINIEPNPMLLNQLQEHRSRDVNLQLGISNKQGKLLLRVYHSKDGLEGISTLSNELKKDYSEKETIDTKKYSDIQIEVLTLKQLFQGQSPKHIHFLKVDVEGFEYEVLSGNDWDKYRPELLCIESNHIIKDWRPILEKNKYHLVLNDGINDYYLANESIYRKDYFDYASIFLSHEPAITHDVSIKLEKIPVLEKELKRANRDVMSKVYEIEALERELNQCKHLLDEITPFRKHLKKQIKHRTDKYLKKNPKGK